MNEEKNVIQPITPDEVVKAKKNSLPDEVIACFNDMIVQKWNGHSSMVIQTEVVRRIADSLHITQKDVYGRGYLEIEDIYRKIGWNVVYDKPAFNENYPAYFKFSRHSQT